MSRLGTRLRTLKTAGGIAGLTITAIVAATVPGVALTNASWSSTEWVHGSVGTENCATATNFSTRGAGKLIGGTLLGANLDSLASLNGVTVTNGASGISVTPVTATSLGSDAYANPLDVSALGAINLSLGSLLQLPLGTDVGVVNQYGQAHRSGSSTGASGVVNNSGGIALTSTIPSASVPTFATLDLDSVLGDLGLGGVAGLADLNLTLGAVASSAQLDGCNALWTKDIYSNLQRKYLIAGLTTNVTSPLVGNLVSTVNSTTTALTNTVTGIAGNAGVINGVTTTVTGLLGNVLSTVGVGAPTATVSAAVNFGALTTLLNTPIADPGNIVRIDLANGTIAINTAALFDSVNGLNNQKPNTQLLINQQVLDNLKAAITSALAAYVTSVTSAIDAALAAITVNLNVTVPLSLLGSGALTISATNVSLASLLAGTAPLTTDLTCSLGLVCPVLEGTVNGLLTSVVSTLASAIEVPLGTTISGLVNPTVANLVTTLNSTTGGIESLLSSVLQNLFGPTALLSLVVNAQNAPNPALAGHPLPTWAGSLPGPSTTPYSTGQYDVSAIQLVVAGGAVTLDLARSSIGTNVLTP
ncbi:MAG: hypothetical protein QOH69_3035 [Actinomycetota bacterium]|jgi:hypothetical protein|nr:hypothetical protein [Actinomycetota bacterium]